MDRRGFLLAASAVVAAGCARVPPPGVAASSPSTVQAAAPQPFGSDGTRAGDMVTQLLASAVAAKGGSAAAVRAGTDWQASLAHGDLVALPGFAATLWAGLATQQEAPADDALLSDLATLLAPDVGVLAVPGVDGGLVWLVTAETAGKGITSLARLSGWSTGKQAAIPALAKSRSDGVPGLRTVYGAGFDYVVVEDPVERASRLAAGQVAAAAFRSTDYTGATGLVALVDTEKIRLADPAVVLLNSGFTEAAPELALDLAAVAEVLTTDALVELQARVVAGGQAAEVAHSWLVEQKLA